MSEEYMIKPDEKEIIGNWYYRNGEMQQDVSCDRIDFLVNNVFNKIETDESGWITLYKDPNDSRYWMRTYPQSHMHGGGPPTLKNVEVEEFYNEKFR